MAGRKNTHTLPVKLAQESTFLKCYTLMSAARIKKENRMSTCSYRAMNSLGSGRCNGITHTVECCSGYIQEKHRHTGANPVSSPEETKGLEYLS